MILNDDFNNYKKYDLSKAKLILTDIPYNIGKNAYASNPQWWKNGDIKEGYSNKADSKFFETDENFNIDNFLKFCQDNLEENGSVITFCSFSQMFEIISKMEEYGFKKYIPLIFIKNNSAEVLKVNMRIIGACEYGLQLIKNRLPEFYNNRKMIKNWFIFEYPKNKIHPNQKPENLIINFIELFTKEQDVVIDPCLGSGTTYKCAKKLNRKFIGFEIEEKYIKLIEEVDNV